MTWKTPFPKPEWREGDAAKADSRCRKGNHFWRDIKASLSYAGMSKELGGWLVGMFAIYQLNDLEPFTFMSLSFFSCSVGTHYYLSHKDVVKIQRDNVYEDIF